MLLWIIFCSIAIIIIFFMLCTSHQNGKYFKMPPSPSKVSILGNIHHLIYKRLPLHLLFASIAKQLGSVFTFWFGESPVVIINDYAIAKKILHSKEFSGRPQRYAGSVVSRGFQGIIVTDFCPALKMRRQLGLKAFKWFDQTKLDELLKQESHFLISNIDKRVTKYNNTAVDISDDVTLASFNIIWALMFNERLTLEDEDFHKVIQMMYWLKEGLTLSNLFEGFPFLRKIPLGKLLFLDMFRKTCDELLKKRYKKHVQHFDKRSMLDLTDTLLMEHDLSQHNIEMILSDLIIAGFETVASTLRFIILYLVMHKNIAHKCRKEIDNILSNRDMTLSDVPKFHYITAVISETLRKKPAAPFGVPHKAMTDTSILEYKIPKNTTVFINIYQIHNDVLMHGDPDSFRPERFLNEDGQYKQIEGFLPFSEGRRECLGKDMAMKQLIYFTVELLQNFSMEKSVAEELTDNAIYSTTLQPQPYRVIFRRNPLTT